MTKPVLQGRSAQLTRREDGTLNSFDLITPSGQIETTSQPSVTQFGMTITFDGSYPVGQFVTGDYFVLPNGSTYPTITAVSPAWDETNGLNGSQLNPVPKSSTASCQGLRNVTSAQHASQSTADQYNASLRATFPLQLAAWDRFIHSIGSATGGGGGSQAWVSRAMVLTCLAEAPASGSFRPPYTAGLNELYNESEIMWERLPQVAMPSTAPTLASVANLFGRGPWLDWGGADSGRKMQPFNQMSTYGREISSAVNQVGLRICGPETAEEKAEAVRNIIQFGIDQYGINKYAKDNNHTFSVYGTGRMGKWTGTIGMGRKIPVFLAAVLLDRAELKAALKWGKNWWQEDGQLYDIALSTCADGGVLTAEQRAASQTYSNNKTWQKTSGISWANMAYVCSMTPAKYGYSGISGLTYCPAYLIQHLFNGVGLWDTTGHFEEYEQYWFSVQGHNVSTAYGSFYTQFQSDMYALYRTASSPMPEVT